MPDDASVTYRQLIPGQLTPAGVSGRVRRSHGRTATFRGEDEV